MGALRSADGQTPKPKRHAPSEVTEPGSDGRTNSNSLDPVAPKKPASHPLEQDFKKPFDPFRSDEAFRSELPPTRQVAPSSAQTKKAKEVSDRKRNWVFSSPEEMMGLQTPEEILGVVEYGPDGKVKVKKSALEGYYQRMENKQAAATNQVRADNLVGEPHGGEREDKSSFFSSPKTGTSSIFDSPIPETRRAIGLANSGNPVADLPSSTDKRLSEFFGLANSQASDRPQEKNRGLEMRTQEFKQLLESSPAPARGFGAEVYDPAPPNTFNSFSRGGFGPETFGSPPAITSFPQGVPFINPLPVAPSYQPSLAPSPALNTARPWTPAPAFELPKRKF